MKNLIVDFVNQHTEKQIFKGKILTQDTLKQSFKRKINDQTGQGTLSFDYLNEGLWAIHLDVHLKQDVVLHLDNDRYETILFYYGIDANVTHQFSNQNQLKPISSLHSCVAHSKTGVRSSLHLPANESVEFNILLLNKPEYYEQLDNNENLFDKKLLNLLQHIDITSDCFHAGSFNPKIALQLKQLKSTEYESKLIHRLSYKGRYFIILAKHIEQLNAEINKDHSHSSKLLKRELLKITELNEFINAHPEKQHCITNLCEKSGLSPAKLQEGFKFLFNTTVADFVREVRLNKAEYLIKETDLSISEVVYTVGLTSRSYFCKIFKRKYKCSPKEYKNAMTRTLVV